MDPSGDVSTCSRSCQHWLHESRSTTPHWPSRALMRRAWRTEKILREGSGQRRRRRRAKQSPREADSLMRISFSLDVGVLGFVLLETNSAPTGKTPRFGKTLGEWAFFLGTAVSRGFTRRLFGPAWRGSAGHPARSGPRNSIFIRPTCKGCRRPTDFMDGLLVRFHGESPLVFSFSSEGCR